MTDAWISLLSEKSPYLGKLGLDNILLIFAGVLYLILYALKMREGHWRRVRLYLFQWLFFIIFGFGWDLYRIESLRGYLLFHGLNYLPFRLGILLCGLGPVIYELIGSIKALLRHR